MIALFDKLLDFDTKRQAEWEKKKLRLRIRKLQQHECGHCENWMKTIECPRENSSMSGYSKGPSCGTPGCGKFHRTAWVTALVENLQPESE